MRKVLRFILLASAAASPSLAAVDPAAERAEARAERQQAHESRSERTESARAERTERTERVEQTQRAERTESTQRAERAERIEKAATPRAQSNEVAARAEAAGRATPRDLQAVRDARRQQAATGVDRPRPAAANAERQAASVYRDRAEQRRIERQERLAAMRRPPPPVSTTPQPNTQPPAPVAARPTQSAQWSGSWRDNHRYDWYNYRHRHRWLFNLGFYNDPFGWGYQRYNSGWRMWPSYYGSQYWLDDPWQYRLPYAPPGYRWVRYWDDAVLVDTWSGEVVDVVYNFFW